MELRPLAPSHQRDDGRLDYFLRLVHLYAGSYSDADLGWWADRAREWSTAGHDVYVYFNNDGEANAVRNARTLQGLIATG